MSTNAEPISQISSSQPPLIQRLSSSNQSKAEKNLQGFEARDRLTKVTAAVISTYVLCWFPYQAIALAEVICGLAEKNCRFNLASWYWLEGIVILGACINPLLYRFKDSPFSKKASPRNSRTMRTIRNEDTTEFLEHRTNLALTEVNTRRKLEFRSSVESSLSPTRKSSTGFFTLVDGLTP